MSKKQKAKKEIRKVLPAIPNDDAFDREILREAAEEDDEDNDFEEDY